MKPWMLVGAAALIVAAAATGVRLVGSPFGGADGPGTAPSVADRSPSPGDGVVAPRASRDAPELAEIVIYVGRKDGTVETSKGDGERTTAFRVCSGASLVRIALAPDGRRIATVCERATPHDARVEVTSLADGKLDFTAPVHPGHDVVAWGPDSRMLAILETAPCTDTDACTSVILHDLTTGTSRRILDPRPLVAGIAWWPIGLTMTTTASTDGSTLIWDGATWHDYSRGLVAVIDQQGNALVSLPRSVSPFEAGSAVLRRDGTTERLLTPPGVSVEYALGLDQERAYVWRPAADGRSGDFVVYDGTAVAIERRGMSPGYLVSRCGTWLLTSDLGGDINALSVVDLRMRTVMHGAVPRLVDAACPPHR